MKGSARMKQSQRQPVNKLPIRAYPKLAAIVPIISAADTAPGSA